VNFIVEANSIVMEVNQQPKDAVQNLLETLEETEEAFTSCVDQFFETALEFNMTQDRFAISYKNFAPYSNLIKLQTEIRDMHSHSEYPRLYFDHMSTRVEENKWRFEQMVEEAKVDKFISKQHDNAKGYKKYYLQSKNELEPFFESIERIMKKFKEVTKFYIGTEGVSNHSINDTILSKTSAVSSLSVTKPARIATLSVFLNIHIDREILKLENLLAKIQEAKKKSIKKSGKYFFDEEFLDSDETDDRKIRRRFHRKLMSHSSSGTLTFEF
jgi:hypothetical protein